MANSRSGCVVTRVMASRKKCDNVIPLEIYCKGFPLFTGTICEAIFVISHLIDSYLISEFPVWRSKANQNMTRGMFILLAYTLLSEMFATLEVMLY